MYMTPLPTPQPLRIDIVSDVVCPWCIIGYKQLLQALAQLEGVFQVQLSWQPFELNPNMPPEGQDLREHIAQKYGASEDQSKGLRSRMTELGNSLGFKFDYFFRRKCIMIGYFFALVFCISFIKREQVINQHSRFYKPFVIVGAFIIRDKDGNGINEVWCNILKDFSFS